MGFIDDIQGTLSDDEIEEEWDETINSMIEDPEQKEKLFDWVNEYRNQFLEMTEDVQDEDEIRTTLVLRYIEIKCHWIMLNTHMQYQAVNTGDPDEEIMVKGSLISQLLERLEQFLDDDDVEQITGFLTKPMDKLSGDELP
ncbi:MAG: hypothetical protein ABEJ65_00140 [bacterium]